jgi:hypothetical protein
MLMLLNKFLNKICFKYMSSQVCICHVIKFTTEVCSRLFTKKGMRVIDFLSIVRRRNGKKKLTG